MTKRPFLAPAAVFLLGSTAVLFTWQRFHASERRSAVERTWLVAEHTARRLELFARGHVEDGPPTEVEELFETALGGETLLDYEVRIEDGDELIYAASASPVGEERHGRPEAIADVQLAGRTWTVRMVPRSGVWSAMLGESHLAFLVGGLALSAALAFLVAVLRSRAAGRQRALEERAELESRLQHSRKMEAIGKLAGGIAHDFNNLMTTVLVNAELIQSAGGLSAHDTDALAQITQAGEQASHLTAQLLTFSRRQKSEARLLDLADEVRRLQPMLDPMVRDDVTLRLELADEAGVVELDPVHLSQVLMNLLLNAADAMPEGGELVVETRRERGGLQGVDGPWVVLSVRDRGVGMDERTRSRVFEPFFTTKALGKGTGLGLSTVYGIVTGAGGDVVLESEPGLGTTVEAWFPAQEGRPQPLSEPDAALPIRLEGTALVVEDEPSVLDVVCQVLREAGLAVIPASDGRQALEIADEGAAFDVVVTDAVMPHVSGLELIRRLRVDRPQLPAVVCSGYVGEIDPQTIRELGATFVPKPFTRTQLLGAVVARLARAQRQTRSRGSSTGAASGA